MRKEAKNSQIDITEDQAMAFIAAMKSQVPRHAPREEQEVLTEWLDGLDGKDALRVLTLTTIGRRQLPNYYPDSWHRAWPSWMELQFSVQRQKMGVDRKNVRNLNTINLTDYLKEEELAELMRHMKES